MTASTETPKIGRAKVSRNGTIAIGRKREVGLNFAGSADLDFQLGLMRGIVETLWLPEEKSPEQREAVINQALATLEGLAPRNEAEGMLVANMIATHHAAIECFGRAMHQNQSAQNRDKNLKHAARLTKAYIDQLAALDKHRGRGQQRIIVEHVTVQAGGQAIVGSVEAGAVRGSRGSRSSGAERAEAAGCEDGDYDAAGAASQAEPSAVGDQPAQSMKPIKPADDDEAKQPPAKVKRRTWTLKTD